MVDTVNKKTVVHCLFFHRPVGACKKVQ